MWVVLKDFPDIIDKKEINYDDFIFILSRKSNLNNIYKTEIKWEWIEFFDKKQEEEIMKLNSVQNLYNII